MAVLREVRFADQVRIEVTVYKEDGTVIDISGATVKDFVFRKPDGELWTEDATFVTDGTDGKLYYQVGVDELDQVGLWKLQVSLNLGIGIRRSTIVPFEVHPNL